MEEKQSFGAYIRRKRQAAGLTQKELAGRLFVTESGVSKWERDLSYPDVSLIPAICRELGISEHEFFTACDDDQAHVQARQAAVWRRGVAGCRQALLAGCLIAAVVCPIVELAVFHRLGWSLIVLASVALPWAWWAVWRFCGGHVLPLCMAITSVWVFPLLAVVHRFTGGGWLMGAAFPLAAVGSAFLWAYFICLRYLPTGPWLKAGVFTLITAVASPVFNALCERLIPDTRQLWHLNYITFAALLAAAVILLAIGALQERKQRNSSD